jgi:outer membrane protein assembly factor BamB
MIRRLLKLAGLTLLALTALGATLYALGLRVELDGGGSPHLRFIESERARAERLARHREAQRLVVQPVTPETTPPVTRPPDADRSVPGPSAVSPGARPQVRAETAAAASTGAPIVPAATGDGWYWSGFRGPARDGHYRQRAIRTEWPAGGLQPVWKVPVGGGYASFAIAGGRAFTIEQRGEEEVVAAYDVASGHEVWTNSWTAAFREFMGGDGPRATPTWFEGILYALGAEGELRYLDAATGRVVWRTNILDDANAENLQWGMAASPLVVDETVIVLPGGRDGRSVVAYNRRTGTRVWSALSDQAAYSSPMLVTLAGVRQIVVFTASRLVGLEPGSGNLLWEYPWKTQFEINAAQPVVIGNNRVFVSSGYGTGAAVLELSPTESGVTVREVWRNNRMKNQFSSSVLHDGYIYGLDGPILACVDAATGDLIWKGGRYGYGQIMLASGHLIVLTEDGDLALVRATPERHEEVVRFPILDGKTWNHPAIADGYLLVRNLKEMAALDVR